MIRYRFLAAIMPLSLGARAESGSARLLECNVITDQIVVARHSARAILIA
ncbi:MAG TPA: hypothetical protein VF485_02540 [Sphingomonas sp.]